MPAAVDDYIADREYLYGRILTDWPSFIVINKYSMPAKGKWYIVISMIQLSGAASFKPVAVKTLDIRLSLCDITNHT